MPQQVYVYFCLQQFIWLILLVFWFFLVVLEFFKIPVELLVDMLWGFLAKIYVEKMLHHVFTWSWLCRHNVLLFDTFSLGLLKSWFESYWNVFYPLLHRLFHLAVRSKLDVIVGVAFLIVTCIILFWDLVGFTYDFKLTLRLLLEQLGLVQCRWNFLSGNLSLLWWILILHFCRIWIRYCLTFALCELLSDPTDQIFDDIDQVNEQEDRYVNQDYCIKSMANPIASPWIWYKVTEHHYQD